MSLETSEKTGRGTGEVPLEVVLSFDGGEDVGIPDDLDGNVDYGKVTINPETVHTELATVVVINNVVLCPCFDEESVASLRPNARDTHGG